MCRRQTAHTKRGGATLNGGSAAPHQKQGRIFQGCDFTLGTLAPGAEVKVASFVRVRLAHGTVRWFQASERSVLLILVRKTLFLCSRGVHQEHNCWFRSSFHSSFKFSRFLLGSFSKTLEIQGTLSELRKE